MKALHIAKFTANHALTESKYLEALSGSLPHAVSKGWDQHLLLQLLPLLPAVLLLPQLVTAGAA
jgi:hypothetical protein